MSCKLSQRLTSLTSHLQLIIINNPNNPTGSTIPASVLEAIVLFARARKLAILSDEVYSPLYHSLAASVPPPPSLLHYAWTSPRDRILVTGSMSKAFALAGIRIGWIGSSCVDMLDALAAARDYTTISVSGLDDQVAAYALSRNVLPALLERNLSLARANLALLAAFVDRHPAVCDWVRPTAGTTALIRFRTRRGVPVDDVKFALELLERTKVMVVPASRCFGGGRDFEGCVRVGYACHTEVLVEALEALERFVVEEMV